MMEKMMKSMTKCVEEMVLQLSTKYGFDKAEAMEFIMPAGEAVRGRPSKPKKKVVSKTEMVEDVIKTIMEEGGAPASEASLSNPALEAVTAQAEAVASEWTGLIPMTVEEGDKAAKAVAALMEATKEDAKQKKKAAPRKKKAEAAATEAVVVETAVVEAVTEVQAQVEPVSVAVEAPKEKKKAAPRKKKAEAPVTEAVVAQAEPVTVASEEGVKGDAPLKKKAAPKKKKAEAPAVVVEAAVVEAVAVVAQAEAVTVASEGGLKGDTPLKKKAAPKNKKEKTPEPQAQEAPKPAPKPAPVAAPVVAPVAAPEELEEEEVIVSDEDDEGTAVKEWTCSNRNYLKSCENNCDEENCNCPGVVYDVESQEQIGTWNGTCWV